MLDLLESTDNPLDFKGQPHKFWIFLAQIEAGEDAANPEPQCTVVARGGLGGGEVESPEDDAQGELPGTLWDYLTFDGGLGRPKSNSLRS